jgi:hypothetical protein
MKEGAKEEERLVGHTHTRLGRRLSRQQAQHGRLAGGPIGGVLARFWMARRASPVQSIRSNSPVSRWGGMPPPALSQAKGPHMRPIRESTGERHKDRDNPLLSIITVSAIADPFLEPRADRAHTEQLHLYLL